MDIHRFLAENEIAVYAAFDESDQSYTIVKNPAAALSYYTLFNQLVLLGDDAYWPSVRNQPLLPQMWAQGDVRCSGGAFRPRIQHGGGFSRSAQR